MTAVHERSTNGPRLMRTCRCARARRKEARRWRVCDVTVLPRSVLLDGSGEDASSLPRNPSHGPRRGRLDGRRRERRGRHFARETHVACISCFANAIRTSSRTLRCAFVSHAVSVFRPAYLGPSRAPSSSAKSHPCVRDANRMCTPFRTCVASHATSRRRMVHLESHVYVRT